MDHIDQIEEVKVITKTPVEKDKDTLVSIADYLNRAISKIEKLTDELYKAPNNESWNKFNQLLEAIQWIISTFFIIDSGYDIEKTVKNYKIRKKEESNNIKTSDFFF